MEYQVIDPRGTDEVQYAVTVDTVQAGRYACEGYGVAARRRSDGVRAEVRGITVSARRVQALVEQLMDAQVPPEELADFAAKYAG